MPKYEAWYEWYPAPLTAFEDFEVKPGDAVAMRVVADSATSGAAYVTNLSTGQSVNRTFVDQPPLCQTNVSFFLWPLVGGGEIYPSLPPSLLPPVQ